MKIFNEKIKYGVAAIFELARNYPAGLVQIKEIARNQDIPRHYLEQLLLTLKSAGIITSTRGARGGYALAKDPADVTVFEVIEALQGGFNLVNIEEKPGVLYEFWNDVEKKAVEVLSVSFQELVNREKEITENLFYQI